MSFRSHYQKLDSQQKEAVDTIEGPVIVLAGPGSGKTELLSVRVANILRKSDVYPNNILCLTFTDAAAKTMRSRLVNLIGLDAHKVAIHTFHSFALDIIYRFRDEFYRSLRMKSADEIAQMEILGNILEKLPLSDVLSTKTPEGKFAHIQDIKQRIGHLKKAGLSPQEYRKILRINQLYYKAIEKILVPLFKARISKAILRQIPGVLKKMDKIKQISPPFQNIGFLDYKKLLIKTLLASYEQAVEENSTKILTRWKNQWLKRNPATKEIHLKDFYSLKRNLSLAKIYEAYQKAMEKSGYIDFNDMILKVIQALEEKKGLLASLQEQYQYILVDEFQDTNDAQMRLIHLLVSHPINEGKPNLMVVGDDDQAIYKFQGAEISNILRFRETYPKAKLIILRRNYRSTNTIIYFTQRVIAQGENRLADKIRATEKELKKVSIDPQDNAIIAYSFDTALHEYCYIAQQIRSRIKKGENPDDIAVIARNHRQLEKIAEYLRKENIPVQYERQQNVLQERPIQELILLARLIYSLAQDNLDYQNELMPTVLSFPFWGLKRKMIWQLSIEADRQKTESRQGRWIDAMLKSKKKIRNIADWLLKMAGKVKVATLGELLDEIIGPPKESHEFTSPFRRYYFSQEQRRLDPYKYLQSLSSLHKFVQTIRAYVSEISVPRLKDLLACVDVYEKYDLPITDTSTYASGIKAVHLLSAHKAKGLEFETVFVINCQKDIWARRQKTNIISFPKNLSIGPPGDTHDDYLRLFFVALTRAKKNLYVTSYIKDEKGKDSLRVPFLEEALFKDMSPNVKFGYRQLPLDATINSLEKSIFPSVYLIKPKEKFLLRPLAEKYIMSVTHLNNFLDVTKGGPAQFFEKNFLRFPQAKSPNMSYGTAMHATIESIYNYFRNKKSLPPLQDIQQMFKDSLLKESMNKQDFKKYLAKGRKTWKAYFKIMPARISQSHLIEVNFRAQKVTVGQARITGKIDKIAPDKKNKIADVYDFKTGRAYHSWQTSNPRHKIQLDKYKKQLIFYKLLIENSRDYSFYKVKRGFLEFLSFGEEKEILLLPYDITEEDTKRLKLLIAAIYNKIQNLDFPAVDKYPKSLKGIIEFEDDLIQGKI